MKLHFPFFLSSTDTDLSRSARWSVLTLSSLLMQFCQQPLMAVNQLFGLCFCNPAFPFRHFPPFCFRFLVFRVYGSHILQFRVSIYPRFEGRFCHLFVSGFGLQGATLFERVSYLGCLPLPHVVKCLGFKRCCATSPCEVHGLLLAMPMVFGVTYSSQPETRTKP